MYEFDLTTATGARLLNTLQFLSEEAVIQRCASKYDAAEKAEARRNAVYAELTSRLA